MKPDLLGSYTILLAFFRARLANARMDLAEDLAQETLLACLAGRSKDAEPIRDPTAYLMGIAGKKLQDVLRRGSRQKEVPLGAEHESLSRRVASIAAEAKLIEADRQRDLGEALARLKPEERDIIALRYNEELSNAEAARRMGIATDEASRLKYRALEKLHREVSLRSGKRK